ncbi:MAG: hypothetical protein OES47_10130 [Acidobacteriota bacterium]|nr:hypothetical protein [Acidobacteriota bacterium]
MVYRRQQLAPASRLDEARRGRVGGRFCKVCCGIYSLHSAVHAGKPMYGRDHVPSPCSHEGKRFAEGEDWWEPAVEIEPSEAG